MSKELEAFYKIKDKLIKVEGNTTYGSIIDLTNLDVIEAALKRLEEHDKIFKEYDIDDNWLDLALYVIKDHFPMDTETQLKKLKALDFIKNNDYLRNFIKNWAYDYDEVNDTNIFEAFNEVLKNE